MSYTTVIKNLNGKFVNSLRDKKLSFCDEYPDAANFGSKGTAIKILKGINLCEDVVIVTNYGSEFEREHYLSKSV